MKPSAASLFNATQKQQIVDAIRQAECTSSAEIRLHIENNCQSDDPISRAQTLFHQLGMRKTALRNGVLLYLSIRDHKVAIIGDKAIHEQVGEEFWVRCYEAMASKFRESLFVEGILVALQMLSEELSGHFPYQVDDQNELSDEISFG